MYIFLGVVIVVGLVIAGRPLLFRKKKPARSQQGQLSQTAAVLAAYFGTCRSESFKKMEPLKAGNATLELLDNIQGHEVRLLRAITSDAMARESLPDIHHPGTEAFIQVSCAIGDVCRQLQKAGYS